MTVIAWDGKRVAADRMSVAGSLNSGANKLYDGDDGEVIAICGSAAEAMEMLHWYRRGATPDEWPSRLDENESNLIIFGSGWAVDFQGSPYPVEVATYPAAWGSGSHFAIGAMAAGKSAQEAVGLAASYICNCGYGVDVSMPTARRPPPNKHPWARDVVLASHIKDFTDQVPRRGTSEQA